MKVYRLARLGIGFALIVLPLLVTACQPLTPTPATPEPTATEIATEAPVATPTVAVQMPEPVAEGLPPVRIAIPEIALEVPVKPMGWESADVDGERSTRWVVPEDAAGWAVNSAGAGAVGNTVLAGYQAIGDAVFAAIALGDVEVGQEILLTDEAGDVFTYRVTDVSDPIALLGATTAETAQAIQFVAPTEDARLTLVSGWPAATTTHRVFVVAELVGGAQ